MTYTPWSFFYFCDLGLLVTGVAIWIESPLLVSMPAVAITLPQILWAVDLLCRLVAGVHATGVTGYMLDPMIPVFLRGSRRFMAGCRSSLCGCSRDWATTGVRSRYSPWPQS